MSLGSTLLNHHPEPELIYLPGKGFMAGELVLTNDREPTWLKINGRPERLEIPIWEHHEDLELGSLEALFMWVDSKYPSTAPSTQQFKSTDVFVSYDTWPTIINCIRCDQGLGKERDCYCKGDPRCKRCQGTGRYRPGCYYCNGQGQMGNIWHLEIQEANKPPNPLAIYPEKLLDQVFSPSQLVFTSPWPANAVWRLQDPTNSWEKIFADPSSIFRSLRADKNGRITDVQTWQQILHRRFGITDPANPAKIILKYMPSEKEMLADIVKVCDQKKLGVMITNREGAMGTGESGWQVHRLAKEGYREVGCWYQLPLALYNAREYFLALAD